MMLSRDPEGFAFYYYCRRSIVFVFCLILCEADSGGDVFFCTAAFWRDIGAGRAGGWRVLGVWQVDRPYYNLPGYYYLHREIPFYDAYSGRVINKDMETISASVSHIVSGDSNLAIPGYTVEKKFGDIQIWCRDEKEVPVRQWEAYNPINVGGVEQIMKQVDPNAPKPPANMGIKWR